MSGFTCFSLLCQGSWGRVFWRRQCGAVFMLLFLFSGYLHARDEEDIFSGYYAYGFEESRFSPVGSKERWWLDKLPPCVEQAEKASGGTPILFVEVVGKLSSVGKFGHLGKYPRELVVKQYLSCRKLSPGERSGLYD